MLILLQKLGIFQQEPI